MEYIIGAASISLNHMSTITGRLQIGVISQIQLEYSSPEAISLK